MRLIVRPWGPAGRGCPAPPRTLRAPDRPGRPAAPAGLVGGCVAFRGKGWGCVQGYLAHKKQPPLLGPP
jgi:hypothetical protein